MKQEREKHIIAVGETVIINASGFNFMEDAEVEKLSEVATAISERAGRVCSVMVNMEEEISKYDRPANKRTI
ncbi:hypothetical protein AALB81_19095 [Lachnospiraceae bacterium 48-33]